LIALHSAATGGCVTTPEFDKLSGITPTTIVQVVKCELIWARDDHPQLLGAQTTGGTRWVAVADLTLQVDESASLAPSFTHTDVVSRSLSRVFNWGVKLDTKAQRTYTQSVAFEIAELTDPAGQCADREAIGGGRFALNGQIGLSEIVGMAFSAAKYVPGQGFEPHPEYLVKDDKAKSRTGSKYFGQSLQFVVSKNVNKVGPTWVLTFFRGPGGFLTMERGDTNKLAISFAPDVKTATFSNSMLLQQDTASRLIQIEQELESF
jgi:hypothetical protein